MIENGTITRIDTPAPAAGGGIAYATGMTISHRCCVTEITRAVQRLVDQQKIQADTELYVAIDTWPTAVNFLLAKCRVVVVPDPVAGNVFPAQSLLIKLAGLLVGGLSAVRCVCKSE
jgi:hypothetical protein